LNGEAVIRGQNGKFYGWELTTETWKVLNDFDPRPKQEAYGGGGLLYLVVSGKIYQQIAPETVKCVMDATAYFSEI
jgi:hypothetical protein